MRKVRYPFPSRRLLVVGSTAFTLSAISVVGCGKGPDARPISLAATHQLSATSGVPASNPGTGTPPGSGLADPDYVAMAQAGSDLALLGYKFQIDPNGHRVGELRQQRRAILYLGPKPGAGQASQEHEGRRRPRCADPFPWRRRYLSQRPCDGRSRLADRRRPGGAGEQDHPGSQRPRGWQGHRSWLQGPRGQGLAPLPAAHGSVIAELAFKPRPGRLEPG